MDLFIWTWQLIGECGWIAWSGWACYIIASFLRLKEGNNGKAFGLFCIGCGLVLLGVYEQSTQEYVHSNSIFITPGHSMTPLFKYYLPGYIAMHCGVEGCVAFFVIFLLTILLALPLLIQFFWKPDTYSLWIFKYLLPFCFILFLYSTDFFYQAYYSDLFDFIPKSRPPDRILNRLSSSAPFDFIPRTLIISIILAVIALLIIFIRKRFPVRIVIFICSMGFLDSTLTIMASYKDIPDGIKGPRFLLDQLCILYPLFYCCLLLTPIFILSGNYINTKMLRKFRWNLLTTLLVLFATSLHLLMSFLYVAGIQKIQSIGTLSPPTNLVWETKKPTFENFTWHLKMKTIKNSKSFFSPIVKNDNKNTSTFTLNKEAIGTAVDGLNEFRIKISKLSKEQREKLYLVIHPDPDTPWWDLAQVINICRLEGLIHVKMTEE